MRFVSKHWRAALTIICLWAAVPVVGESFIDFAREKGFYKQSSHLFEGIMNAFIAVADLPGFRQFVLLLVGLVAGVWLDTFVRQRVSRSRSPAEWYPLGKAIAVLGASSLNENLRLTQERARIVAQQFADFDALYQQKAKELFGRNDLDEAMQFASLNDSRARLEAKIEPTLRAVHDAQRAVDVAFLLQLAEGELLAKGMLAKQFDLGEESDIPAAFWRVFSVDRNDPQLQTVGGNGMRYVGVRIARA